MNVKFRSLMYREWRVSRKTLFSRGGLLIGWLAFMILAIVSGAANTDDITAYQEDGMIINFAKTTIVYSAFISAMCALAMDDVFQADLKSGWLRYSYTLPVTPLERALSRFTRRTVMAVFAMSFSLLAALIICAMSGDTFKTEYVVWQFIALDVIIAMSLLDAPMFAARTADEVKPIMTKNRFYVTGFYILLFLGLLWKWDFNFSRLMDDIMQLKTPDLGVGALIITVLLMFVLAGAEFGLSYHFFKNPYSAVNAAKAKKSKTASKSELPEKTDGMTGLLYKEFVQNKTMLLIIGLLPFGCMLMHISMHLFATILPDGEFDSDSMTAMNLLIVILSVFIVSNALADVFKGDDKKLWAYFISSTPQGAKGFLYYKYVLVFAGCGLFMVSLFFEQALVKTYFTLVWNESAEVKYSFAVISFFILLFLCAADIPFVIRFGSKKGSFIKLTVMLAVVTVAVVGFGLLPEKAGMWLTETLKDIYTGKANGSVMLFLSVLPYTALGAFLLSYKLSCKLFMKGVSEYDK